MISFLSDKVHTNYVPILEESLVLRQELSGPNQRLADMEVEICKVQEHLQELNQQKNVLEAKLTGYRGLLSPVRCLLPEILQEIFIRCLPVCNAVMSASEAPLLLGRVCRQWRNLAYSTPILWSSIHISIPSDAQIVQACVGGHASRRQAIETWLSRAGVCPLSISICGPHDSSSNFIVGPYIDVISLFLTRCYSFHFSCTSDGTWKYFLRKCVSLEFLSLSHIHLDITIEANAKVFSDLLRKSPLFLSSRPHTISLPNYGYRALELPIRWNQLVVISLHVEPPLAWDPQKALSVPSALLLLSWCPSLAFCSVPLSETSPSSHTERSSAIISLPALVGLSIRCDFDPKSFFLHLSTPYLRRFRYYQEMPQSPETDMNGENRALHLSLCPFIQRVIRPIEELQILITYLTARDVVRCLELFPELKRLSLLGHGSSYGFSFTAGGFHVTNRTLSVSDWILEKFIQTTSRNELNVSGSVENSDDLYEQEPDNSSALCLCPKLEMLDIQGASFSDTLMLSFIRSRVLLDSPTRDDLLRVRWFKVYFPVGRTADPEIEKKIGEMREQTEGHINISYGGSWFPQRDRTHVSYTGLVLNSNGALIPPYHPFFGPILVNDDVRI